MKYSIELLKEDLEIGHEIEFKYLGEKFSITRAQEVWNFMRFYDYDSLQVFPNVQELLNKAKIGSSSLKDIWLEVITIF